MAAVFANGTPETGVSYPNRTTNPLAAADSAA
jgi:hypothetical protein